jgi:hypothetical protein
MRVSSLAEIEKLPQLMMVFGVRIDVEVLTAGLVCAELWTTAPPVGSQQPCC